MFRRSSILAAIAMAATAAPGIAQSNGPDVTLDWLEVAARRRQVAVSPMAPERFKRSKGAQAKPKRKPNRRTISERTRRKHRRAA